MKFWFSLSLVLGTFLSFNGWSQVLRLPTANRALFQNEGQENFFAPTPGKSWVSGTFGCVRTEGWQMHEGLDIRSVQKDRRGEPTDPVMATADGVVAYANRRSGLSNYGNYIILRHYIHGLELYSLYAHLSQVRSDLKPNTPVRAGETIGVMGRTSNTRQRIDKSRAHVHFEFDLLIHPQFASWYRQNFPGQRNDHGNWNGLNLVALDPQDIFLSQAKAGTNFNLLRHVQSQPELFKVWVNKSRFPWVQRHPGLVMRNPAAEKEGIAGFEVSINFNGLPFKLVPRSSNESRNLQRYQILSVNQKEAEANHCRKLLKKQNKNWTLTPTGLDLLDLLSYQP